MAARILSAEKEEVRELAEEFPEEASVIEEMLKAAEADIQQMVVVRFFLPRNALDRLPTRVVSVQFCSSDPIGDPPALPGRHPEFDL